MRVLRNLFPETKNMGEKLALYTPAGGGRSHIEISRRSADAAILGNLQPVRTSPETWVTPHLLSIASPQQVVSGLLATVDALPSSDTKGPAECVDLDDLLLAILSWVLERARELIDKVVEVFAAFQLDLRNLNYDTFLVVADFFLLCRSRASQLDAGGSDAVASRRKLVYQPLGKTEVTSIFERIHVILDNVEDSVVGGCEDKAGGQAADNARLAAMCCYQSGMYLPPGQPMPLVEQAAAFTKARALVQDLNDMSFNSLPEIEDVTLPFSSATSSN